MEHGKNWKQVLAVIWTGQGISILSSSVVGYAVIFYLSLETGSAETLAFAALAGMLPQSLLGLVAGVWIDRWDRKRTMILADSFIALCTLALALLFRFGAAELWHVYALLACRSIGSAFHTPAMEASMPLLAPAAQLTRIAGVNQSLESASSIAGPALGALLLAFAELSDILLLDVAGALIACGSLAFVRIPNPPRSGTQRPALLREMRECAAAIRNTRGMTQFFGSAILVLFFIMPVGVLFPLMTLRHFGGGVCEMSLIEIVWGGGSLAGGLLMGLRSYRIDKVLLIQAMYVTVGASFLVSGLLPPAAFALFTLLQVFSGIAGSVFKASFVAVVQRRFAPGMLGRVLSLYSGLSMMPAMLGVVGSGFLADSIGLNATFVLAGAAIAAIGIAGCCSRSMRRLGQGI